MRIHNISFRASNLKQMLAWTLIVCVCLSWNLFSSPQSVHAEDNKDAQSHLAPLDKMVLEDGDTIVFLGDSITHQCLYTQYFENYIYTRFPGKRIRMHNAGVGGAKAWDAIARFEKDVASYKPKYVTVLLGMNDGRYTPFNQEYFDTYLNDMAQVVEQIKAIGATPILMTPTMFDARARRINPRGNSDEPSIAQYNAVLAYYGAWMREVAVHSGFGFVDMYGPLNQLTLDARKQNPQFTMIKDAVHPDAPGQVVMAAAMVNDLGLPRQLSNIRIQKRNGKDITAFTTGGKVSDLKETEDGIEFTWLANSLPWVLPADAALGVQMTKMGHKLTREALGIHDLKPGVYQLSIDDQAIGRFHSSALARHIELQGNQKTPQYQQAAQVAELNAERNNTAVKALRGEWRKFQVYARVRATQGADAAAQEKVNQQVASLEKQLEGADERIAKANAAAKVLEDKIFTINQPKPRKYVLKRVTAPKKKPAAK